VPACVRRGSWRAFVAYDRFPAHASRPSRTARPAIPSPVIGSSHQQPKAVLARMLTSTAAAPGLHMSVLSIPTRSTDWIALTCSPSLQVPPRSTQVRSSRPRLLALAQEAKRHVVKLPVSSRHASYAFAIL
jgi:hypothetical protein